MPRTGPQRPSRPFIRWIRSPPLDEFMAAGEIVKTDPRWRDAMAKRGITALGNVAQSLLLRRRHEQDRFNVTAIAARMIRLWRRGDSMVTGQMASSDFFSGLLDRARFVVDHSRQETGALEIKNKSTRPKARGSKAKLDKDIAF